MSGATSGNRPKARRGIVRTLLSRYRLVLIDEGSFEERFALRLTRLNVLVAAVLAFALLAALVTAAIVLTPLKRFIPGYPDDDLRLSAYRSALLADSLEAALAEQRAFIANLRLVLSGQAPVDSAALARPAKANVEPDGLLPGSPDSALRARLQQEERYSLVEGRGASERRELASVLFVPPVQGIVTSSFDRPKGHFGADIVTAADAAVKACLSGTVAFAGWTSDAGHVLALQHTNGLVSLYKHNRVLLKAVGDRVRSGEAIAIVGSTGAHSTGPHLHFELWHNGEPVDPAAYMVFQ
ncbi:MAG: M23 family metallopeptidase [Flavobacteriales bacterium]